MVDLAVFSADNWSEFLQKTISDYRQFCQQPAPDDAKSFMLYHNACKAVLAHLLMIKKIIEGTSVCPDANVLMDLLKQAQMEVQNDPDDDSFE
ncbi:MAG: hypothetical protein II942_04070 [Alphaproteobacteria bacterium]|nr:hypothetical protein [Alphaproteobacteria bacterium]